MIIVVIISGAAMAYAVYALAFGIDAHCMNPLSIWRSSIPNAEFDRISDEIFSAPDFRFDSWVVMGGGHKVWVANDIYGFELNGVRAGAFSYLQRKRFLKRAAWMKCLHPDRRVQIADFERPAKPFTREVRAKVLSIVKEPQ